MHRLFRQFAVFSASTVVLAGLSISASAQEVVTLNYLTHDFAPAVALNEELIAEFEAANPDIDVVYEAEPNDNYEQSLLTALASGAGPDVFWAGDWLAPQFLENNVLAPVDPTAYGVSTQEEFMGLFAPGSLDAFVVDGQVHSGGVSEYNTFSLLYNVDQFIEAGLELPSATEPMTWEEFAVVAEALARPQDGQPRERNAIGFFIVPIWSVLIMEPMIRQAGGEIVDPETGAITLNTPEVARVLQFFQDLRLEQNAYDPAFQVSVLDDFAQGRVSALIAGPWAISITRQLNPELNFAVMPMPVFDGGERVTTLYSWAWYVNARTTPERQAAGWRFIEFLTSQADRWWDQAAYIQAREVTLDDGTSIADYRAQTEPLLADFAGDFAAGRFQFRSTAYYEIANVLLRALTRALEGEDIALILEDAQAEAEATQ
jgi:multiple sugar transport system substrate-binding protein